MGGRGRIDQWEGEKELTNGREEEELTLGEERRLAEMESEKVKSRS